MFTGNSSSPQLAWGGKNEQLEFLKAWLGTTLVFMILYRNHPQLSLWQLALVMGIAAGLGIVIHELAHRIAARRYGSQAHFMANDSMLVFAIVMAFTGFTFLAPGAVWHRPLSSRQTGIIAAVGPVSNMILAVIFLIGMPVTGMLPNSTFTLILGYLCLYGYLINALLGIFNMIPFGPIDGAKILNWDRMVFFGLGAVAALLFGFQYMDTLFNQWLASGGFRFR